MDSFNKQDAILDRVALWFKSCKLFSSTDAVFLAILLDHLPQKAVFQRGNVNRSKHYWIITRYVKTTTHLFTKYSQQCELKSR